MPLSHNTHLMDVLVSAVIPNGITDNCINDGEDSNSTLILDGLNDDQSHTNRNFVVTPPQTESAKILLSLAQSRSVGQYPDGQNAADVALADGGLLNDKIVDSNINSNIIFDEQHGLVIGGVTVSSACGADHDAVKSFVIESELEAHQHQQQQLIQTKQSLPQNEDELSKGGYVLPQYNGEAFVPVHVLPDNDADANTKSLLAKLLTRSSNESSPKCPRYSEPYKVLSEEADRKNQNSERTKNSDLQSGMILDFPFMIETPSGYINIPNMENILTVFDDGDVFGAGATGGSRGSVKIISRDEILGTMACDDQSADITMAKQEPLEYADALFERVRRDTEEELRSDPEAVVLTRVTEDGTLEKCVLSSADIQALKEMNERLRQNENFRSPDATDGDVIEIESSRGDGNTPLITRIMDRGRVENAISKLPFKRCGDGDEPAAAKRHDDCVGEHILDEARLSVDSHHHENMFEELDNQFNLDCSIVHMGREYVAYEEASKNETQLEHNYYANAIKDEDEQCDAVMSESYDLRTMAMIEEPLAVNGGSMVALAANGRRKNANVLSTLQVINAQDVYLKGCGNEKAGESPRRNGFVEKPATSVAVFNGKCDLVLSGEALAGSASLAPPAKSCPPPAKTANGSTKNFKTFKSGDLTKRTAARNSPDSANTLPFKSVKNTSRGSQPPEKKSKKTYKRKTNSSTAARQENLNSAAANGLMFVDNSLIEEIVVDEIS